MKRFLMLSLAVVIVFPADGIAVSIESRNVRQKTVIRKYEFPKAGFLGADFSRKIFLSPFEQNEILLLYDYAHKYILNLNSGKWEFIIGTDDKLEMLLSDQSKFIKDAFDGNLVWVLEYRKLIFLNIYSGAKELFYAGEHFNGDRINIIQPDKNCVWIGTDHGLYCYDRERKIIFEIRGFNNLNVRSISVENDRLWINGEYIYQKNTKSIVRIHDFKNWPLSVIVDFKLVDGYKIFSEGNYKSLVIMDKNDKIISTLDRISISNGVFIDNDRYLWLAGTESILQFCLSTKKIIGSFKIGNFSCVQDYGGHFYFVTEDGIGRIQKSNGSIELFPVSKMPFCFGCNNFIADSNYFYILTQKNIIRISKKYSHVLFKPISYIKKRKETLDRTISFIIKSIEEENDIINKIRRAAELFEFMKNNALDISEYDFKNFFSATQYKDIRKIIEFSKKECKPVEKEIAYYLLSTRTLLLGEPELAYEYYKIFKKRFPGSVFLSWIRDSDVKILKEISGRYKEIKNKEIPDDERLWLLGNIFLDACNVSWNEAEVGFDPGYAFGVFRKLIKKYPNSEWADDAEYKMLLFREGLVHEGGDLHPSCIKDYEEFIKKYPKSELAPEAKLEIGRHCLSLFEYEDLRNNEISEDEIKDYLSKAGAIYKDLVSSYPNTKYAVEGKKSLEKIEQLEEYYSEKPVWTIEIATNAKTYLVGENVVIYFKLKNLSKKNKKITVYRNLPNFGIDIRRIDKENKLNDVVFERDITIKNRDYEKTSLVMAANGGEFFEEQHIQKIAKKDSYGNGEYGRFKLDKAGTYRLRGVYRIKINMKEKVVYSEEISFTINEQ